MARWNRHHEHAGPMQSIVLMALKDGSALTAQNIADKTGRDVGSIKGAISGMIRMDGRHWIKRHRELLGNDQWGPKYAPSLFTITEKGLRVKLRRPPEQVGPWSDADLRELVAALTASRNAWIDLLPDAETRVETKYWIIKDEAEKRLEDIVTKLTYESAGHKVAR